MARPIEFDKSAVLTNALNMFWCRGYEATGISDLVKATGLKRGSLYAAFESKQGLFMATLDVYGQGGVDTLQGILADAPTPVEGIRVFFEGLTNSSPLENRHWGCMLVNTMVELGPHNGRIRDLVNSHLNAFEACFEQALVTAQSTGDLLLERSPADMAAFLMIHLWGIRVLQKAGREPKLVRGAADEMLTLLGI